MKIESCGFKTKYSLDDGIKEIIKFYPTFKAKIIEIFNLYYLVFHKSLILLNLSSGNY